MKNKTQKAIEVMVRREIVSAITCGKDTYEVAQTADKRGVTVRNGQGNIFIPVGAVGQAIAREIAAMTVAPKAVAKKRVRRSKAQIEADNLAKGITTAPQVEDEAPSVQL